MMNDAKDSLVQQLGKSAADELSELLYADDTLLLGTSGPALSVFLRAVAETGAEYGMSLHVGKTQLIKERSNEDVLAPTGAKLPSKDSMIYLGGLLSNDGR